MPKAIYILPIVLFTALCAFFVSYNASTAPANVKAQIRTERTAASEPAAPEQASEKAPSGPAELPELGAYPELEGVRMDINTADTAEWEKLPGIGPKKAEAIAAYIQEHGPLDSVDDLLNVKGIGEKTLDSIRPYLTAET